MKREDQSTTYSTLRVYESLRPDRRGEKEEGEGDRVRGRTTRAFAEN